MQIMLRQIEPLSMSSLDEPFMQVWRKIRPLVQRVLDRNDEYAIGDVLHFLSTGVWHLWLTPNAFAVTEVIKYPQHKSCVFVMSAGDLEEIKMAEPEIVQWARENGCKYTEIHGREGWIRALGYRKHEVVMRKEL